MIRPLALSLLMGLASLAQAHDYNTDTISVLHPHIFATPPNAPVASGYLTLVNQTDTDDVLLSVEVPADKAGAVQIHRVVSTDGVVSMEELPDGLLIPAGEAVVLTSGGMHLMLTGLPKGLSDGDLVPATLTFRDAGQMHVAFVVKDRSAGHGEHAGHGS